MSTEHKKDWFIELNLVKDKAKILEWGRKNFPTYSKNENMMAQMWWTQHEGKILPELRPILTVVELRKRIKEFIDNGDLADENGRPRKAWGNIEVLVVGPLGDSKPYFGCDKCNRGVDKNIGICVNDDADYGHPGLEVEGKMVAFQNWQAGDGTDEVIVSFAPNNKQTPERIQGRVLQLSGSMNVRDGRYTVWEIVANKTASIGGSGANIDLTVPKKPEPVENDYDNATGDDYETFEEIEDDAQTADESASESTEDFDDAAFFEDAEKAETEEVSGSGGDLRSLISDYDGLLKHFKNSLERHVGTKKVPVENMVRYLLVRPQVREFSNPEEIANAFLKEMVEQKLIKIDGDYLTRV